MAGGYPRKNPPAPKRWNKVNNVDCPPSYVAEHWFYGQGLIRNWLEGLYWSVKCTVIEEEGKEPDYKYTQFLFSIQNLRDRGIAAATYVISNPAAVKGVLQFCMDELEKRDLGQDTVFDKYFEYRVQRGVIQQINKLGGVVELSAFSQDDFYNYLVENRDYIKSIGDRKKEKKERDAELAAAGLLPKKKGKKKKHRGNKRRR